MTGDRPLDHFFIRIPDAILPGTPLQFSPNPLLNRSIHRLACPLVPEPTRIGRNLIRQDQLAVVQTELTLKSTRVMCRSLKNGIKILLILSAQCLISAISVAPPISTSEYDPGD